jgi:hypothetical protein
MTMSLLIWETVPEKTDLYLIPNHIATQYRNLLEMAHGKFINSDEMNEGMEFLNAALCSKEEYVDEEQKQYACIFHPYLWGNAHPIGDGVHITHVYLTGFIL